MSLFGKRTDEQIKRSMAEFINTGIREVKKRADEEGKEILIVRITRKGEWTCTILEDERRIDSNNQQFMKSDRYVMKDFDFSCIRNRVVIFFDDSLNNGNNMFFFYSLFVEKGAAEVYPFIYAVNTAFLKRVEQREYIKPDKMKYVEYSRAVRNKGWTEELIQKNAEIRYNEFCKKLKYFEIMTPDDIARLSLRQLKWIDEALAPFTMDLPILVSEKKEQNINCVLFTEEEWENLCQESQEWGFEETVLADIVHQFKSVFFYVNSSILSGKLKDILYNFVVKCKYKKTNEGIKATFVPFAIVRSFHYEEAWEFFQKLFRGTDYYAVLVRELGVDDKENISIEAVLDKMTNNHNWGRAVIRAVIYALSLYIAFLFKEKVMLDTGKEINIDLGSIDKHNIQSFKNTIKKMWEEYDKEEFEKRLLLCETLGKVPPINYYDPGISEKIEATELDVEEWIHFKIIETRDRQDSKKERILTIETIEEIKNQVIFANEEVEKNSITKAMLLLVDSSRMSNELLFDNDEQIIYRGFKAGENCELLFPKNFFWVYIYAYTLFYLVGEEDYKKYIGDMLLYVELFFREKKYFPVLISERDFKLYKDYFINLKNPEEQIQNKEYLLDKYLDGGMQEGEELIIREAFSKVKEWVL